MIGNFTKLIAIILLPASILSVAEAQTGTLDPLSYTGSDIGAKINAAAATCATGSQCWIVLPPGTQLAFTTTIAFVANETVQCPVSGTVSANSSGNSTTKLSYTGTGAAITMNSNAGHLLGCDLLLGSSAQYGIVMGGYSNHADQVGVRGGGTATTLVHISGTAAEDNHLSSSRLSDFVGVGVAVDHANDTFLTNITAYGSAGNTTSTTLLVDAGAGGLIIDNFAGGSSGLHGFWERYYLSGNYPSFIFANNFTCDLAASDCYLFDSTLGSANIDATFLNSWAAGAGAAGIHISGGSGIHIGGGTKIRNNAYDGITIDGGSEVGIQIEGNYIQGNNQANVGKHGISINGYPTSITITGNEIGNWPEVGGNQGYALWAASNVQGLIFTNNNCSYNVSGCALLSAVSSSQLTYASNISNGGGVQPSYFPGVVNAGTGYQYNGTAGFTGTKVAGSCTLTIQGGIITAVSGC